MAHSAISLRPFYAKSGTNLAYGATATQLSGYALAMQSPSYQPSPRHRAPATTTHSEPHTLLYAIALRYRPTLQPYKSATRSPVLTERMALSPTLCCYAMSLGI
eukprot:1529341-Rhodomonas_salina.2